MATEQEIRDTFGMIKSAIEAKGYNRVDVQYRIAIDKDPDMYLTYYLPGANGYKYHFLKGDGLNAIVRNFWGWVENLKSVNEMAFEDYMTMLATAKEHAEKHGFEEAMVNPLAELMAKLSSNALEYKPNPAVFDADGDDIPF